MKLRSMHRRPPLVTYCRIARGRPPRADSSRHQLPHELRSKTTQGSPGIIHRRGRSAFSSPTPAAELHLRFHPLRLLADLAYRRCPGVFHRRRRISSSPPPHRCFSVSASYAPGNRCRSHCHRRRFRPPLEMRPLPTGSKGCPLHFSFWLHRPRSRQSLPTPTASSPVPPDRLHPAPAATASPSFQ